MNKEDGTVSDNTTCKIIDSINCDINTMKTSTSVEKDDLKSNKSSENINSAFGTVQESKIGHIKVEAESESFSDHSDSDLECRSSDITKFVEIQFMKVETTCEGDKVEKNDNPIHKKQGKKISHVYIYV